MSVDISLYDGDLALSRVDLDSEGSLYDLVLEDSPQSTENLLRRAVITPPSWIGRWVLDADDTYKIDNTFGNGLYLQLSDPLTYDWISLAYQNVRRAIAHLTDPTLEINSIDIGMGSMDSVNVNIVYTINGVEQTVSTQIVRNNETENSI